MNNAMQPLLEQRWNQPHVQAWIKAEEHTTTRNDLIAEWKEQRWQIVLNGNVLQGKLCSVDHMMRLNAGWLGHNEVLPSFSVEVHLELASIPRMFGSKIEYAQIECLNQEAWPYSLFFLKDTVTITGHLALFHPVPSDEEITEALPSIFETVLRNANARKEHEQGE